MAGRLGSGWRGQMWTMKYCPMRTMRDPDFSNMREISSHGGYWLEDDPGERAESSCLWIQTMQGYVAKLG